MLKCREIPERLQALDLCSIEIVVAPRDSEIRFALVSPPWAACIIKGETDENKSGFVD